MSGDDLLTARDIAEQYGISQRTAEGLLRNLGRRGLVETIPGFRRCFVRRKHVQPATRPRD
jgi:DNA-binding IscR family transcriptional regulator